MFSTWNLANALKFEMLCEVRNVSAKGNCHRYVCLHIAKWYTFTKCMSQIWISLQNIHLTYTADVFRLISFKPIRFSFQSDINISMCLTQMWSESTYWSVIEARTRIIESGIFYTPLFSKQMDFCSEKGAFVSVTVHLKALPGSSWAWSCFIFSLFFFYSLFTGEVASYSWVNPVLWFVSHLWWGGQRVASFPHPITQRRSPSSSFNVSALPVWHQEYHGLLLANLSHHSGELIEITAVEVLGLP